MPDGSARTTTKSPWISGPLFDSLLLIGAPVVWLAVSLVVVAVGIQDLSFAWGEHEVFVFPAFALTFTMAHVSAVFFRSHGRPEIFRLHPIRFTVVPLTLLALFTFSHLAFLIGLVVATWFDNYHSSMQTFGIGRLYDMRAGNGALVGRRLDMGLALVVFMGPILGGVAMADSLKDLSRFDEVGLVALTEVPGWVNAHQAWITWPLFGLGVAYIAYYVFAYRRLAQRGYVYSRQKVVLWVLLASVSLWMWGFDSFGQSFLVMESFHSMQYFALLWWSEKGNLGRLFRTSRRPALSFAILLALPFAFGLWCATPGRGHFELSLFLVVEIMHYWWDGFIWSVRKKQVS